VRQSWQTVSGQEASQAFGAAWLSFQPLRHLRDMTPLSARVPSHANIFPVSRSMLHSLGRQDLTPVLLAITARYRKQSPRTSVLMALSARQGGARCRTPRR